MDIVRCYIMVIKLIGWIDSEDDKSGGGDELA